MADIMNKRFQQRDFNGIFNDMQAYLRERLRNRWSDFSESDELTALIETFAYEAANINFYADQQKRETDIITAVRLRNVYNKAIRDGYTPHGFRPASGELTLRFSEPVSTPVIIPKGTQFQTNFGGDDLIVTTLEDQKLDDSINPALRSDYTIRVYQGQLRKQVFKRSDMTQNNYIKISSATAVTDIGFSSVTYEREPGELIDFVQVTDVMTSPEQGYLYSVHCLFLKNETLAKIQFPFNWEKSIDTDGDIIIEYFETNFTDGTIEASVYDISSNSYTGGVSEINSILYDSNSPPKSINTAISDVFNQTPLVGWDTIEDIGSIKINVKAALRDLESLITMPDIIDYIFRETSINAIGKDINTDLNMPAYVAYIFFDMEGNGQRKDGLWVGYEDFDPSTRPDLDTLEYIKYYAGINSIAGQNMVWNAGNPNLPQSYKEFWKNKYNGIVQKVNDRIGRPNDIVVFQSPVVHEYEISALVYLYSVVDNITEVEDDVQGIFDKIVTALTNIYVLPPQAGRTHYMSKIIDLIHNASERVASVELITPTTDITAPLDTVLRFVINQGGFRFTYVDGFQDDILLPVDPINSQNLL